MARISMDCSTSLPGIPLSVLSVPMENKYKCQQCLQVLRRPVQAQCGHRFCVHCFKLLTSSGPKPCEACRQEEIYEEPISILNSSESQHEGRCEYERIQCEACQNFILHREKDRHNERECEARTLNCKYCKMTFNFKDIKAHDEICLKFPLQCKDCGKKKITREKIENGKLSDHEQSSTMEHLRLLLPMVLSVARTRVESSGPGEWQEDGPGLGLYRAPGEGVVEDSGAAAPLQSVDLDKKVTALENIVCVLNREVERSSVTLEAFAHQHRLDQEKIENLSNKVRQLERTLTMRDLQLSETEQMVRELQFCTYDGIFVWKIAEFSRRRQDAVAGRTPAMFSPAFYSSKYGYKMCLRLYLNGDGTGRGTHLSLFFVVMRGKYDALLKWPFSQKVTLMLLDQNNREHIIDAFRPDVTSTSFQKPISEMNIASGCPLFCPLAKLAGKSPYLRDDTIFIKAIVDLTGL
ncbi:TNF receptor-associated factor 2 [Channa argus]|uniref:TNF receptor-associated factor n=1 Tax=Channa argus TaxID=215402 RepID=A0A6G1QHQ0_CHAAH|nr:TNF receptor-associated factor 2 [Channa argus]